MYIYTRMTVLRLTWIISFLFVGAGCSSVSLIPPKKTPIAASEREQQLLQLAREHFTQSRFQAALQNAQEVISLNPDNVEAQYAAALTYMALDKYDMSLEFSKRAAAYRSEYLPDIYLLMGESYQQLDDPWNALRTYRFAATQYPDNPIIQTMLGDAYAYLDKLELASDAFKAAIHIAPGNAKVHYRLGLIYYSLDYKTPALLSLSTSLLVEPGQARASLIRKNIIDLLARGEVSKKTDEGDFQSVDAALIQQRTALLNRSEKYTAFEIIKAQYLSLFKQLNTAKIKNQKTFVMDDYVPFYNKIHLLDLDETFVYYIFQGTEDENIRDWLEKHADERKQLEQLFKATARR